MIKITGVQELLWSAQEGVLSTAEAMILKSLGYIEILPGNHQPKYLLTAQGNEVLQGLQVAA